MFLSEISITRPIAAIVLSVLMLIFGIVSFSKLPVRELPEINEPSVSVVTSYAGAAPNVVETKVTKPIEDELSGISGIKTITSTSRSGHSRINVEFNEKKNMIEAVSDIRDAVSRASKKLPKDVDEPITTRDNGEDEVVLWLNLSSTNMQRSELSDLTKRFVEKQLSLVDGVSQVKLVGAVDKVMYITLDPDKMNSLEITVDDIVDAIGNENIELPSGEIRNDDMYFPVKVNRVYTDENFFGSLPIKHDGINGTIRLREVADIEFNAKNGESIYHRNGVSSIGIGIIPQSNANPLEVAKAIRKEVDILKGQLTDNVVLALDYDSTIYIQNSIDEVYETLVITALLVILFLYLFIGSWRITIIPAITVPISLIAAFIGAYIIGFSINLITLLSLILAIGLVVDDAIVMVENISYHLKKGENVLVACWNGAREVGFAIVATTVVLVMIFLPLIFIEGVMGSMFTEFALLLSFAVVFSSVVALTLAPALSSILLKTKFIKQPKGVVKYFDFFFTFVENKYEQLLKKLLFNKYLYPGIFALIIGGIFLFYSNIIHQFVPTEDRGVIYIYASGQEGASIYRMKRNMALIEEKLLPFIDQGLFSSVSFSTPSLGQGSDQSGFVIIQLVDWSNRTKRSKEIISDLKLLLSDIPDLKVFVYEPGFKGSSQSPVRYVLKGQDYDELNRLSNKLLDDALNSDIIVNANTNYTNQTPEIEVSIRQDRASVMGISLINVSKALQTYLGGTSHTSYVYKGEEYDVFLKAEEQKFVDINKISSLAVRSKNGQMVTLGSVAEFKLVASSKRLPHYDRQKAITVRGYPAPNKSLGEVLDWMDDWAKQNLTKNVTTDLTGESKNFRDSESDLVLVIFLSLVVTYLVLCAQFENFAYPIVVMITIPLGVLGGLIGLWVSDVSLNIYSQIGFLLLIGMVTKNGILIVEYANQLRAKKIELLEATVSASKRRFKPIMMTSLTAIIGAVPLLLGNGSGYESRESIGVVIFYGMTISTLITICILPGIYYFFSGFIKVKADRKGIIQQELSKIDNE